MSRRRIDGLSVKSGPTESGEVGRPISVGGVVQPPLNYLALSLLLLLVLSIAVLFHKKRDAVLRFFAPALSRFPATIRIF